MPWKVIENEDRCPTTRPWGVVKEDDDTLEGCHPTEQEAEDQQAALYASEGGERKRMNILTILEEFVEGIVRKVVSRIERRIKDVEEWDGSAARFDSTADYCDACLINLNEEAGNTERDDWTQNLCKLPVREPGDGEGTYVRQAMGPAAAALAGARTPMTKPADVTDEEWETARQQAARELIRAYDEADEEAPESLYEIADMEMPERAISTNQILDQLSEALWEFDMETGNYTWINGTFHDGGDMFAIITMDGKLYRIPIDISGSEVSFGEWMQVVADFPLAAGQQTSEVPEMRQSTKVFRQADGRYRWVSVSCTAVINRNGEIDSTVLFDDFVARINDGEEYPYRDFYHLGEKFRIGQADFVARDGVALITSGLYDEDNPLAEAEIKAREADPAVWGDSIYFQPAKEPELWEVSDGIKIPVYTSGTLKAISTLPEKRAAALFTATTIQEVNRMRKEVLEALAALFGGDEEKAREFAEGVDETNRSVSEGGMIARQDQASEEEGGDVVREIVLDENAIDAISEHVLGNLSDVISQIADLQTAVSDLMGRLDEEVERSTSIESRIQSLERTDDEKQQEWVSDLPRSATQRTNVTYRPRIANASPTAQPPSSDEAANQTLNKLPTYSMQQ